MHYLGPQCYPNNSVLLHRPWTRRVSEAEHLSLFPVTSHANIQSKWKRLGCDVMSLFLAMARNVMRISGFETLPQVLILQIFNAQIPSLLAHESSLWIQCTLHYRLAGCLFCPFCYTSRSAVIQMACYAFVSLFNLWVCRRSLSHWFLERCKKNKWARESLTLALMGWIQAVLGRDLLWPKQD